MTLNPKMNSIAGTAGMCKIALCLMNLIKDLGLSYLLILSILCNSPFTLRYGNYAGFCLVCEEL